MLLLILKLSGVLLEGIIQVMDDDPNALELVVGSRELVGSSMKALSVVEVQAIGADFRIAWPISSLVIPRVSPLDPLPLLIQPSVPSRTGAGPIPDMVIHFALEDTDVISQVPRS